MTNPTPEQIEAAASAFTCETQKEWDDYPEVYKGDIRKDMRDALVAAAGVSVSGTTSDGHHTFDELYDYRMLYNAHAANGWLAAGIPVVKSWKHSDGELCFGGGWFIVTATLATGQVSNHYKAEHWGLFAVPEVDLPPEYDGHTPQDAAERLRAAAGVTPQEPVAGKRLDPGFRAELVDIAKGSIQAVWDDVPAGVDAETLAQNVVGAQEFAWIARGFPVTPQEPTSERCGDCGDKLDYVAGMDGNGCYPHCWRCWYKDHPVEIPVQVDEAKLAEVVRRVDSHEWSRMGGSQGEQVAGIVRDVLRGGQ